LGDLEAVIMDRLWDWGTTATVRDVVDDLQQHRKIAYTTVMTVMDNLHNKGWLARERDGKAWRYEPTATRAEFSARLMREALDSDQDQAAVFTHFLAQMSDEESQTLRTALRRMPRRRKG
jgi:predicted transcriptional regulator